MSKINFNIIGTTILSTALVFSAGTMMAAECDATGDENCTQNQNAVAVQARKQLRTQTQDETCSGDATCDAVAVQAREQVRTQTRDETGDAAADQTRTQVREQIRDAVSEQAKDAVRRQTRGGGKG